MKKYLIIILVGISSYGQLTKVETVKPLVKTEVGPLGEFWIGANVYEDKAIVTFKDANFVKLTVYESFAITPKEFEDLYNLLIKEDNKEDDTYTINTIDKKALTIKFSKSFGYVYPIIALTDNVKTSIVPNLNKSQIRKLFNHKK